jgi:3-carboxy-cis,cis-muconate cycloisomerase
VTFSALDSGLTGPLLATASMRACFSDRARLAAMLQAEAALARSCSAQGLAPEGLAEAIEAIRPEDLDVAAIGAATALSGVPTIPFVKAVQALLPPEMERAFHKGATTQDIMDTALVLQCRQALALLQADLLGVLAGLSRIAVAHRATPCAGRTYGQHAAPITFGFKAAGWLSGVAEAAERLPVVRARLLTLSLAGPVGTLAALGAKGPAVMEGAAASLGLAAAPIAWHTRRGRIAEAGCWLAELIGAVGKLAADVANLASTEVSEVAEPHVPGRGGSSAMPHKRNPVSCTVILAAHAAAPGQAATLLGAMAGAHERPAGLWHAEWHALPALFGLASGALHEARTLAEGMEIDPARMRANLDATKGMLFADAAAGLLTAALGRGAAHHAVEHAASEVRRTGQSLQAVLAADPALAATDLAPAFDLAPAIAAAGPWVDRAVADGLRVSELLQTD